MPERAVNAVIGTLALCVELGELDDPAPSSSGL